MTARPPRIAERLLTWTLAPDDRDVVLGDLAEEFAEMHREQGARSARRWYRRQLLRSASSNLRGRWEFSPFFRGSARDVHDAIRSLRASPSFTVIALIVLTLGIGASTAIFSVVDAVVLRDLPLPASDRLVVVGQTKKDRKQVVSVAPQDYADWRAQQDVFDGLAAWSGADTLTTRGSQPEALKAIRVTANLFSVLRVAPRRGSLFSADNENAGADHVALISDGFWQRHFGAAPDVVGQMLDTDSGAWRIVGVMPPGFAFPLEQTEDLWIPLVVTETDRVRSDTFHSTSSLQLIGRLKPGVTVDRAQERMTNITTALAAQFPDWFKNRATTVVPLRDTIIGTDVQAWMLMLLAAVTFVLLIACVNVASLMLARASARGREMGVRAAIGASRWQLVRGVLIESLLLSAVGTACGLLCTYVAIGAIRAALPGNLPRSDAIAVNWRVWLAATTASIVTGLVCGVLPGLQASRADLTRALRDGGRAGSAAPGRHRLRAVLVGAEVGLAIILLIGAGLFMSSFIRLTSIDLGLDYHRVLTVGLNPKRSVVREARTAAAARVSALVEQLLPIVQSMPGVEHAAALSGTRPLQGGHDRTNVLVHGRELDFQSADDAVDVYRITRDYPVVLGVTLLRGRLFQPDENMGSHAPVTLLNDVAAARFFPGVDPVGQTIGINGDRTVVGVLHSVRVGGPETEVRPEAYLPFAHDDSPLAYLVVKTTGDPAAIEAQIKGAVWSVAPDLPLSDVQTLEGFFAKLVATRRFNMLLIGLFGVLALAIASVGIYGVMAYIVEQRTAEIGLRMALGAAPGEVVTMILRRALAIIAAGLAIGLVMAWPLAQTLRAFLFHVQPHELVVYAMAAIVLMAAGLVAAFGPARRASRVDPIIALRAE